MHNVMKFIEYKTISDKVIVARIYKDEKSVGYTYKYQDDFDTFKKAMSE